MLGATRLEEPKKMAVVAALAGVPPVQFPVVLQVLLLPPVQV